MLIPDLYHASWMILPGGMMEVTLSAKVEPGTYMAFGRSGSDSRSAMVGGDVTVAWYDTVMNVGKAVDYSLSQYTEVCLIS